MWLAFAMTRSRVPPRPVNTARTNLSQWLRGEPVISGWLRLLICMTPSSTLGRGRKPQEGTRPWRWKEKPGCGLSGQHRGATDPAAFARDLPLCEEHGLGPGAGAEKSAHDRCGEVERNVPHDHQTWKSSTVSTDSDAGGQFALPLPTESVGDRYYRATALESDTRGEASTPDYWLSVVDYKAVGKKYEACVEELNRKAKEFDRLKGLETINEVPPEP